MRFTKMQGLGNDYVYVDGFDETVEDPSALAPRIADRHFGVGGDGLILVLPPGDDAQADVRMRMFNADGSEAEMCGNGVRCVAKYAWDQGRSDANPMRVETGAGVKTIELRLADDGTVAAATVDMGEPVLAPARIPVDIPNVERVVDLPLRTTTHVLKMTCVSMGNPHAVMYVDDAWDFPLETVGPQVERHHLFPQRVNAHFVEVHDAGEATVRTWERGSGATLACGTGAAAVCVAGVLTGRTGRTLLAHLPGGALELEWRQADNRVYMTGPAVEVFTGDWPG
ncbi:MAG: diaminopimelate epimerase [Planctomycetota bacterium]